MTPTARLEITEDGGVVFAVWYSSKLFPDAGSWPVGALYGFRDGGTLYLRNTAKLLADGGLEGGTQFIGTITGSHLEGVDQRTTLDGGPLPIYLKLDRSRSRERLGRCGKGKAVQAPVRRPRLRSADPAPQLLPPALPCASLAEVSDSRM